MKQAGITVPLLLAALAGCTAPPAPPPPAPAADTCLLPSQQHMLIAELFFGRNIRGRKPLTDAEWTAFARDVVTPNFPAGLTVFDGRGQWQDPATGVITHERTKILLVAAPRSPDLAGRLSAVIDAYKLRFHEQSVGIITRDACAGF